MARGIIRKLDELGRITIPIEIRKITGIDTSVHTDLIIDNGVLRLRRGKGRCIDEVGRYTIPMEIRKIREWETGQELEIYADGDEICIGKDGCIVCGATEQLLTVEKIHICRLCATKVISAFSED